MLLARLQCYHILEELPYEVFLVDGHAPTSTPLRWNLLAEPHSFRDAVLPFIILKHDMAH